MAVLFKNPDFFFMVIFSLGYPFVTDFLCHDFVSSFLDLGFITKARISYEIEGFRVFICEQIQCTVKVFRSYLCTFKMRIWARY